MDGISEKATETSNEYQIKSGGAAFIGDAGGTYGAESGRSDRDDHQGEGEAGEYNGDIEKKECAICFEKRTMDRFSRNRRGSISRRRCCNVCMNKQMSGYKKEWAEENREHVSEFQRNYREKHKDELREKKAEYNRKNPEKQQRRMVKFLEKNPEYPKVHAVAYRAAHLEEIRARKHIRYILNAQAIKEKIKIYKLANPEKIKEWWRASSQKRRARSRGVLSDLTTGQWKLIKDVFNHCCAYCGKKPKVLTQDHITPLVKYGPYTMTNIVPACKSCNSKKQAGPPLKPVQPLLPLGV